jgi:LPXTG-motif cell wall-anchored protein
MEYIPAFVGLLILAAIVIFAVKRRKDRAREDIDEGEGPDVSPYPPVRDDDANTRDAR